MTHEWTPSGLSLLKTITDEIARSGGSERLANLINRERTNSYACLKKDCAYCVMLRKFSTAQLPQSLTIMDTPMPKRTRNYSKEEINILKANDHLPPRILALLLNRTTSSIKSARNKFVRSKISNRYRVTKFRI
jgi:hypothetical protein